MNSEDMKKEEQQAPEQKDVQQTAAGDEKENKPEGAETSAKEQTNSGDSEQTAGQDTDGKEEESGS